jgi:hypothetical protein
VNPLSATGNRPMLTIGNALTGTPLPPLPGPSPLRRAVTSKPTTDDRPRHLGF